MKELNLSSEARRRRWKGYSLLLRWADEAEENSAASFEPCESQASIIGNEIKEVTDDTNEINVSEDGDTDNKVEIEKPDELLRNQG